MDGEAAKSAFLGGIRVLIVEDEYFLADDLRKALVTQGAIVLGPVATVEPAIELLNSGQCDFAILDINLRGEQTFEIARESLAKGVPIAFATGYDQTAIPAELGGIRRFEKPLEFGSIVEFVAATALDTR
ncbi:MULTISPECIES: response regulator [unclassified Mesorhizobium]|uniref:response regulator n=1 Tax=unclassified Mesorhizobium TaxID=325217 RepID=UPI0011272C6A|nr:MULTISPECIES: response regulator [unclassified Mesorhizobium]TPK51648.1 response regulator [Mesorhizobium sp. B2-5-2]TPL15502.1 response regulator [Mesorhizobium sp. B2-4-9]TPL30603.1 response regulator [Mesorhizobium sp. B2-4-7]TPL44922.1 response regulator [Mesorhizobium sp. B2-4-5]TPM76341.1 response regulator [Mesorhizobium sp. B2-1-6]